MQLDDDIKKKEERYEKYRAEDKKACSVSEVTVSGQFGNHDSQGQVHYAYFIIRGSSEDKF